MVSATPAVKFTIGQYDLMVEAGVFAQPPAPGSPFAEPPRVELLEGEIVMMSRIGSRHEEVVDRLTAWSFHCLPDGLARVRVQQSLGIPGSQSVFPRAGAAGLRRTSAGRTGRGDHAARAARSEARRRFALHPTQLI